MITSRTADDVQREIDETGATIRRLQSSDDADQADELEREIGRLRHHRAGLALELRRLQGQEVPALASFCVDLELSERADRAGLRWSLRYPGAYGGGPNFKARIYGDLRWVASELLPLRNEFETGAGAIAWLELELRQLLGEP